MMNSEQASEILKCRDDVEYFANTYIHLSTYTGKIQCKLNNFQREVIDRFKTDRVFFIPADRISGKTTIAAIILLHQALFMGDGKSLIFARNKSLSDDILKIIAEMYELLPDFLKHTEMISRNKSRLDFSNMYSIISAGSNPDYGRGMTISAIYIDESELVDCLDRIMENLYPCMPSLHYSRLFALSSTKTGDKLRDLRLSAA